MGKTDYKGRLFSLGRVSRDNNMITAFLSFSLIWIFFFFSTKIYELP